MRLPRLIRVVLRVPLAWKIAGANAAMLVMLAFSLYAVPAVLSGPSMSSALLISVVLAAAAINWALVSLALNPIHQLERAAQDLWRGASDVRVRPSLLADREVSRVARTINALLEQLAVDRSRLQTLTEQLIAARSSERAALAHELTESVAQSVTALSLELAALQKANELDGGHERLKRLGRATNGVVEEIRRLARDVYPRHLDQLGLESALRSLASEVQNGTTRQVTFTSGKAVDPDALPYNAANAVYDVAREALQNANRYSGAKRIDVWLGAESQVVTLSVTDDGCGFDPAAIDPKRGLGLSLMRERMALVGGSLEILSRPGIGATIRARVPLEQAASNKNDMQPTGAHSW